MSGSTRFRPAYQELLAAARRTEFDVVLAEALDRLSRDQEDVAALFKALRFSGVKLVTLSEGEINELHVGLKGSMNALFLKVSPPRRTGACEAGSRKSAPPAA
jgi:DNA invertase Pin-like site-specific DNA recombinase